MASLAHVVIVFTIHDLSFSTFSKKIYRLVIKKKRKMKNNIIATTDSNKIIMHMCKRKCNLIGQRTSLEKKKHFPTQQLLSMDEQFRVITLL